MTGVQRLREARGWSQAELARRAGVPRTSLIRWEQNGRVPLYGQMKKLAAALGVVVDQLDASA